jgi:xanthine dehydrogenase YagR molybdenum-binding subunit
MATATVVPAVAGAARHAVRQLIRAVTAENGPMAGESPDQVAVRDGHLVSRGATKVPLGKALGRVAKTPIIGEATAKPGDEAKHFSFKSFGAHCVEVRWDPGISRLRVTRVVSAFDVGRIINRMTARNQIDGAIVMGLGAALHEQAVYDRRTGRVVNDNLADYLVPVHADMPEIDVTLLDIPDPHIGDFGAKGLGEIGVTGVTAAVANAVFHAAGRRIRELPVTIEKLIETSKT